MATAGRDALDASAATRRADEIQESERTKKKGKTKSRTEFHHEWSVPNFERAFAKKARSRTRPGAMNANAWGVARRAAGPQTIRDHVAFSRQTAPHPRLLRDVSAWFGAGRG